MINRRQGMSNAEARLAQLQTGTKSMLELIETLEGAKAGRHDESVVDQLVTGQPITGNRPQAPENFVERLLSVFDPNTYKGAMTRMEMEYKLKPYFDKIKEQQESQKTKKEKEMIRFKAKTEAMHKPPEKDTRSAWEQVQDKVRKGETLTPGDQKLWDAHEPADQTNEEKEFKQAAWKQLALAGKWEKESPEQIARGVPNPYPMTEAQLNAIGQGRAVTTEEDKAAQVKIAKAKGKMDTLYRRFQNLAWDKDESEKDKQKYEQAGKEYEKAEREYLALLDGGNATEIGTNGESTDKSALTPARQAEIDANAKKLGWTETQKQQYISENYAQ